MPKPYVLYGDDILIEISRHKSVGFFYSIKRDTHLFLKDLQYFDNKKIITN
tara:strand:+ start:777 stop:929 length:153 start_codon:yes stop_codon:yes gene_type:complete